jgi:hypothetical protein
MVKNNLSRKCLCLLLALGIISIAGGDVQGAKGKKIKRKPIRSRNPTYQPTEIREILK